MSVGVGFDGAVAVVTVEREEAMNALDVAHLLALRDRLGELAADERARCVVLTGAGERAFIGGADIKYMVAVDAEQASAFAALGHEVATLLETMPKPTIAAVNGFALGGGCELALACDLRYAASSARFGQPEVNYGLVPGWGGTQRLARATSLGFAKELILTGRIVVAAEALARGLVEAVHDPVLERALETGHLLARKGPQALAAAKELLNRALQGDNVASLRAEAQALADSLTGAEGREGLRAFLEKRAPSFEA